MAEYLEVEQARALPGLRLVLPPPTPSSVEILGEGPSAAPAVVDLFEQLGVLAR